MRIALVNKFVHLTGGADRHCLGLAEILRERGHEVAFLSTASPENVEHDGVFVRPTVTHRTRDDLKTAARADVALRAFWNPDAASGMKQLIASFRPDIVHVHKLYPQLSIAPVVVASGAKLPVVQTLHDFELVSASTLDVRGGWFDRDETRLSYKALNSATFLVRRRVQVPRTDSFISVSRFIARVAESHRIPSSVLPNFITAATDGRGFDDRNGVIFLGRLRPEKGVLDVVELAKRVPDLQVTIVGSGMLADEIEARAAKLPNLTATGFVPNGAAVELVRSARVMVIPSRCYEPGPLVALEAMAHATPTVVYANGGLAEYVSDARSGLVVPPDVESLARSVRDLHEDEATWKRLSANGTTAATSVHSREHYGEQIERLYESLL